jgi:hypothetical protein
MDPAAKEGVAVPEMVAELVRLPHARTLPAPDALSTSAKCVTTLEPPLQAAKVMALAFVILDGAPALAAAQSAPAVLLRAYPVYVASVILAHVIASVGAAVSSATYIVPSAGIAVLPTIHSRYFVSAYCVALPAITYLLSMKKEPPDHQGRRYSGQVACMY